MRVSWGSVKTGTGSVCLFFSFPHPGSLCKWALLHRFPLLLLVSLHTTQTHPHSQPVYSSVPGRPWQPHGAFRAPGVQISWRDDDGWTLPQHSLVPDPWCATQFRCLIVWCAPMVGAITPLVAEVIHICSGNGYGSVLCRGGVPWQPRCLFTFWCCFGFWGSDPSTEGTLHWRPCFAFTL